MNIFSTIYFSLNGKAEGLTREVFETVIDSLVVKEICALVAQGDKEAKKRLPAATWMAHFKEGSKRDRNLAAPSPFVALDIDHVPQPDEMARRIVALAQELSIFIVHKTPSLEGLRVVALRKGEMSIEENQAWLAERLQTPYDPVCKDLGRLFFLVPREYFYLYDPRMFDPSCLASLGYAGDEQKEESGENEGERRAQPGTQPEPPSAAAPAAPCLLEIPDTGRCYHSVSYRAIVTELISRTGGVATREGHVMEGDRNNTLYNLARHLRYITDFRAPLLKSILPTLGLSAQEIEATVQSALKSTRSEKMPSTLYGVLQDLGANDTEDDEREENEPPAHALPPCPPGFDELVSIVPQDFKEAAILALLPVWGTLCTRLRCQYLDDEWHSPSFFTMISAPQGSGKSFARKLVNILMEPLIKQDDRAYEVEDEYQRLARRKRNAKELPEKPKTLIRYIPGDISVASLLERLKASMGLHLFSFCEEIDTMAKGQKVAWNQKSDVYRCAFDNSDYGQSRAGEDSVSGHCKVYYNLLVLGTRLATRRFFNNSEDGLVTRIIFPLIPDQFGAAIPRWGKLTKKKRERLDRLVERAMNDTLAVTSDDEGQLQYHIRPLIPLRLPWLCKAIEEWLEEQNLLSIKENSRARDTFRRRGAVMGFRAGMLAFYLWGCKSGRKNKQNCCQFALWVARQVTEAQIRLFGKELEDNYRREQHMNRYGNNNRTTLVYDLLPETFTKEQLQQLVTEHGLKCLPKEYIRLWRGRGLVKPERVDGKYVKAPHSAAEGTTAKSPA